MNYNSNSSKVVYVDIDALTSWSNQINEINERANEELESLKKEIENLNSYWEGNFASGFIDETTKMVESEKICHNDMKGVAQFLIDVINSKTMQ